MSDFTNVGQLLNDMEIERDEAIERADALAAEVERLRAELANRPPGYLAALDARDEAQLYLIRIMAALDMVVNDTTYDEVAAEVERLKDENAALRAQLDAGEGSGSRSMWSRG